MNFFLFRSLIFSLVVFFISQSAFSQVKNRLELGAGVMKSREYIDFLVKVKNNATFGEESGEEDFFMVIKVSADAAMNSKLLSYLDFSFEIAPSMDLYDDEQKRLYLGYNLVTFKQQKNIDLDQQNQYQLSLLGFRIGGHVDLNEDKLKLFGQLSIDLLSVIFDAQRSSDDIGLSGKEYGKRNASGINGFIGLDIKEKVRVVLGGDVMLTNALGYDVATGDVSCTDYYDDFGNYLSSDCTDITQTVYDERWVSSKLYAEVSVNMTKSLSIFGRASYNVFKMTDDTGFFPSSKNSQWQFMLGAKYSLFSSNQ